jgi:hypothetical protein
MRLNSFLNKYNSEDNNSLKKLIKTADEDWKKKFAWMFK